MPIEIDDQYVDVDFTQDPNYVFGDLGGAFFGFTDYSDVVPEMTESEIFAAIERMEAEDNGGEWGVTRIYNQGREGSCVANANAQGNECIQCKEYGPENVIQLSAISLYKKIGRSASSGATISNGMAKHRDHGILPLDTQENRALFGDHVMPNTGFNSRYPAGYQETAKQFRLAEYHIARTTNAIWTALCNRDPVIVGRDGHSICYLRPRRDNNSRLSAVYANSWPNWGFAAGRMKSGFGADSIRQVEKSASYAVVVRSLITRDF